MGGRLPTQRLAGGRAHLDVVLSSLVAHDQEVLGKIGVHGKGGRHIFSPLVFSLFDFFFRCLTFFFRGTFFRGLTFFWVLLVMMGERG